MACFNTGRFYFSVLERQKVIQKVLIEPAIGAVEPKEIFPERQRRGKAERKSKRERGKDRELKSEKERQKQRKR